MPAGGSLRPQALTSTLAERLLQSNLVLTACSGCFENVENVEECRVFSPVLAEILCFSDKVAAGVY